MVTATKPMAETKTETRLSYRLAGWVEEQLQMGDSLGDAVEVVIGKAITEHLADEILTTMGHNIIRDNWRYFNRRFRPQVAGGQKRIDASVLNREESMLESLWNIGSEYHRLGSMNKELCAAAKDYFGQLADSQLQRKDFFAALERALKEDECVADRFTHEQLQEIFKQGKKD